MSRAERLARLARAQRALAEVAKADSITARKSFEDSAAQADEILGALNARSVLHGLAVSSMAETLKKNGRTTEKLRRAAEAMADQHNRQDRTAEVLEERAEEAARNERRAAERHRLLLLACASPRSSSTATSLPPASGPNVGPSAEKPKVG